MKKSTAIRSLLLAAMIGVLGTLIGLVRSSARVAAPRSAAGVEDAPWVEPQGVVLRAPVFPPPLEEAALPPAKPSKQAPSSDGRRPPPTLGGIVLRPDGEPASRARVVLGQQQAHCSADGRFELVLARDAENADLIAFEPGHEPVLRPAIGASLASGGVRELRLVLGPETSSLSGTVTARDGRPVKGWSVELDGPDPLAAFGLRERVRTDIDGNFVIPDVPAGIHVVRAWKERPALAFHSAPAAAGEGGLVIAVDAVE